MFTCQKPMKGGVGFSENYVWLFPPPVIQWWKNWHNFLSIGQILPKQILVRQKHSLCVFSKKNWLCLFPTILAHFCPKFSLFCLKSRILVGNRQTQFCFSKIKSLDHEDVFGHLKCYKITKSHDFMFSRS